jgi:MFS transporter, SHS family, lactate transporter
VGLVSELKSFAPNQRNVVIASFLGWMLDAFDFFLLVFVMKDIAVEFDTQVHEVSFAIMLTLALRPLGAFIFGILADRYGRRPILMIDIVFYSLMELFSAAAPSLLVLLVLRALFGVAMGGEWGLGASLTMETIPPKSRGAISGLLQEGYACGYLLAALVYFLFYDLVGWRGMFAIGVVPALLVVYIRGFVEESPAWLETKGKRIGLFATIRGRWPLFLYTILLMTMFNFFSHGTQDLYPTFLQVQHKLPKSTVSAIAVTYNIGAILGGVLFGAFSERIGRRRAIILAALLSVPIIPLWAFSTDVVHLGIGAFLMQFMVQGAWGVVPAHLNELSPHTVRGTFPGFTYQLGNLLASYNSVLQTDIATSHGDDYGLSLALVAGSVAVLLAIVTWLGKEAKGAELGGGAPTAVAGE